MFSLITVPSNEGGVTLALSGSVSADVLPEIANLIQCEQQVDRRVKLDLSEVTLMDRVAAQFFARQIQGGVELVDCPSYLRPWILREVRHEREES